MKRRTYRVGAFGYYWYSYSLLSSLTLIASLKADYGPGTRITLVAWPDR